MLGRCNGYEHWTDKGKVFGITEVLSIATWNVSDLVHKGLELRRKLMEKGINIAVIAETKKKFKATGYIEDYLLLYCGVS